MSTILHFKELKCWQKALDLNEAFYFIFKNNREFYLRDQMLRATLSILNNIAEGFGRKSSKEKIRFFEYSTSSCYEVESMTFLLERLQLFENDKIIELRNSTIEIFKMVSALSKHLQNSKN